MCKENFLLLCTVSLFKTSSTVHKEYLNDN